MQYSKKIETVRADFVDVRDVAPAAPPHDTIQGSCHNFSESQPSPTNSSPDIEKSVASMAEIGMTGAELRMVFGKNIIDLTDEELDRAKQICKGAGMEII